MANLGYRNSTNPARSFGINEWLETRGLAGWLEIATDGLEAPARQRIANEIGLHYAEAVNAHQAAGESEHSAQTAALAELGDPQKAALDFQKSDLTEFEAKLVKWMERTAAKPIFSIWAVPLDVIPLAGFALLFSHAPWITRLQFDPHFFACLMLVAYAGFRLIPRLLHAGTLRRNSFLRALCLSYLITDLSLSLAVAQTFYMQGQDVFSLFDAVFIVVFYGFRCNPGFKIWSKLRKMGDERNDLPPRQTTAS